MKLTLGRIFDENKLSKATEKVNDLIKMTRRGHYNLDSIKKFFLI